jgi:predicted nucleic acid-binding protein
LPSQRVFRVRFIVRFGPNLTGSAADLRTEPGDALHLARAERAGAKSLAMLDKVMAFVR